MNTNTTWDLTPLATNDIDQELTHSLQQSQRKVAEFVKKWSQRQDYLEKPDVLVIALDEYENLMHYHGLNTRASYYYDLRTAQDQLNTDLKGMAASADEQVIDLANQIQFFTLAIAKIPQVKQADFLGFAGLQKYHHFLQQLFKESHHTLTDQEEKILNLTSQPAYQAWVRMTETFLSGKQVKTLAPDGRQKDATLPELLSLSSHQDKKVRDKAAKHIHAIMSEIAPIAVEEMNAILQYKKTTDQLRKFARPDASRHLSDDIDSQVVDQMLNAVEQRYDIAQRFYKLKARLFGLNKLAYHERNLEYGHLDQHYEYPEAVEVVTTVFRKLDPEFASILESFVANRQIDVYPRPGKSGGAFCAHRLITQPSYVLLNHTDKLRDVLTLAHEMGHAINNELMRQKQNALNFDTPLATAEVASTFMEDFVLQHLAQSADASTQLAINMMKLNDDVSSIFRQVAGYRFEQSLHNEHRRTNYVSQERIGQLFAEQMKKYMGPAVVQSAGSQNWWVYWSHFRHFFYVYSYASGLLISKSLQAMVHQDPSSISKVKELLAAGSSASPLRIFQKLDLSIDQPDFWQQGLSQIENLLHQTEKLADQLGDKAIQKSD